MEPDNDDVELQMRAHPKAAASLIRKVDLGLLFIAVLLGLLGLYGLAH